MMTRYLLGDLPEVQLVEFEARYFADPTWLDLLEAAEFDLVEGYVNNKLSSFDRERFERSWLNSPSRREKLAFVQSLVKALSSEELNSPALDKNIHWPRSIVAWLKFPRLVFGFSVALLLGLILIARVNLQLREQMAQMQQAKADQEQKARDLDAQLETERARTQQLSGEVESLQERLINASQRPAMVSFAWAVSGFRGEIEGAKTRILTIPANTQFVQFSFKLPTDRYQTFQLDFLAPDGKSIWQKTGLKTSNRGIKASFPISQITDGEFRLILRGKQGNEEQADLGIFPIRIVIEKQR